MSREVATPERFLSPVQVAARYGLTVAWCYHCRELNEIKIKIGKYIRYRESDLIAMEERTRVKGRGFDLQHLEKVIRLSSTNEQKQKPKFKLRFDLE